MGGINEEGVLDTEALSKACKEISKSWPILVAGVISEISFPKAKYGPFLVVNLDRTKVAHPEKLHAALQKMEMKYVLRDEKGCYSPFKEGALRIIDKYLDTNTFSIVWKSPALKAAEKKLRSSGRGR